MWAKPLPARCIQSPGAHATLYLMIFSNTLLLWTLIFTFFFVSIIFFFTSRTRSVYDMENSRARSVETTAKRRNAQEKISIFFISRVAKARRQSRVHAPAWRPVAPRCFVHGRLDELLQREFCTVAIREYDIFDLVWREIEFSGMFFIFFF